MKYLKIFFIVKIIALVAVWIYLLYLSIVFRFQHPDYTETQLFVAQQNQVVNVVAVIILFIFNVHVLKRLNKS